MYFPFTEQQRTVEPTDSVQWGLNSLNIDYLFVYIKSWLSAIDAVLLKAHIGLFGDNLNASVCVFMSSDFFSRFCFVYVFQQV